MKTMNRLLVIIFLVLLFLKVSSQSENQQDKKMLIILDGKEKIWSNAEFNDSINWSNVKTIKQLPDSISFKIYKEKAKNGVLIVTTKSMKNMGKQNEKH